MTKVDAIIEIPATITTRGQTTVPAAIRRMLTLGNRDRVVFRGLPDGTVTIARAKREDAGDPVIAKFLDFLERDMAAEPGRISPVPSELVKRGQALVEGIAVDLEMALPDDDA